MSHGMIRFIATLFLACLSLMAQGVEEVIYYQNDALGSPIIATDQEGRVVWRKSYAPYGQPIGQTAPNEPGYTGKLEEPDLGIQDFGARWYDPRIGRFLAIDPAGFDPQNPQSFNRYAYANNNPYKYVDPDGRVPLLLPFIVGLGLELGNLAWEAYDNGANPCGDCVRSSGVSIPGAGALGKTVAKAADEIGDVARTVTNGKALTTFDPPNDGFLGKARDFTLTPGAKVERFGFDGGRFLAPEGTPAPMRALRPGTGNRPYTTFTVTKPLDVKAGENSARIRPAGSRYAVCYRQARTRSNKRRFLRSIEPMNVHQLEQMLQSENIHPAAVRINHGLPDADEQYCIVQEDGRWEVYYAERGQKGNLKRFYHEHDACEYLLSILKQDASVWLT